MWRVAHRGGVLLTLYFEILGPPSSLIWQLSHCILKYFGSLEDLLHQFLVAVFLRFGQLMIGVTFRKAVLRVLIHKRLGTVLEPSLRLLNFEIASILYILLDVTSQHCCYPLLFSFIIYYKSNYYQNNI